MFSEILKPVWLAKIRTKRIANALLCHCLVLFLCSCATESKQDCASARPAEARINKEAGRGGLLFIALRLENGKEFPFIVDTGSPITFLDKSLEPHLGKRLGTNSAWLWGDEQEVAIYAAPKLTFQNFPLKTGPIVITCDLKKSVGWRAVGILGTDCLKHYCIELDFKSKKMRFLDSAPFNTEKLGKAFPLALSNFGQTRSDALRPFVTSNGLLGTAATNTMIDTGLNLDGALEPSLLHKQAIANSGKKLADDTWRFPKVVWANDTYTDIMICRSDSAVAGPGANVLGLRFLARHLVTLDFPRAVMYLQKTSSGPL